MIKVFLEICFLCETRSFTEEKETKTICYILSGEQTYFPPQIQCQASLVLIFNWIVVFLMYHVVIFCALSVESSQADI